VTKTKNLQGESKGGLVPKPWRLKSKTSMEKG